MGGGWDVQQDDTFGKVGQKRRVPEEARQNQKIREIRRRQAAFLKNLCQTVKDGQILILRDFHNKDEKRDGNQEAEQEVYKFIRLSFKRGQNQSSYKKGTWFPFFFHKCVDTTDLMRAATF